VNNISRRTFFKTAGLLAMAPTSGCITSSSKRAPVLVNDVHTQLNPTLVRNVSQVDSLEDLQRIIRSARGEHRPVCIAGGRHAAGGQQFAEGVELIDTRELKRVLKFDPQAGTLEVETGIQWPDVLRFLVRARSGGDGGWTVIQKQTGTDRLSIGGALSANAHGRGLTLPPFISTVDSIVILDGSGTPRTCSRTENPDLFKLAIGGYGMFGFIYSAKLRLSPLRKVRRVVTLVDMPEVPGIFAQRIKDGFIYGDCQFAIDSKTDDFLKRSVMTCYEPVPDNTPLSADTNQLSERDWRMLVYLAHVNPSQAFDLYTRNYIATSGRIYTSETQYVSDYFEDYHHEIDSRLNSTVPATEVISELYVPREALPSFFRDAATVLRRDDAPPLIYGNIRLIEPDRESFLAWAKGQYACVIFNLHTPHDAQGSNRTAAAFRRLIDAAIRYNGSYYLTYHRYATREQVLACYPQFPQFLKLKRKYDPEGSFQSDWYRHYKKIFGYA